MNKLRAKFIKNSVIEYMIRDSVITHFYDPPHLLKSLRNNLLVKDLYHIVAIREFENLSERVKYDEEDSRERVASWTDVKDFYDFTLKSTQETLPKIHDEHIKPVKLKMKVCVAAQVFSRSYGRSMQLCSDKKQFTREQHTRDFTGTANILHFFNDVFDSLNGGGVPIKNALKGSINKSSDHFNFWNYAIDMLNKMHFADLNGRKDSSKVLSDYIVTIKGLSQLTKAMLIVTDTVALRRTTQHALENFFGGIRSVIYSPTVREFRGAYAASLVNNLCLKHSIYSNCEEDKGPPLLHNLNLHESLNDQHGSSIGVVSAHKKNEESNVIEPLPNDLPSHSIESLEYTAGAVCKKLLKCIKCTDCLHRIEIDQTHPSKSFLKCFQEVLVYGEKKLPTICMEYRLRENFVGGKLMKRTSLPCES